jgi:hypothetical protein
MPLQEPWRAKIVLEHGFGPATIIAVALVEKNAMNEQAIAASGQRSTTGADVVRGEVLARVALGHSKRKIARDLHIGRHRLDAILAQHQSAPLSTTRVARITPLAYDAVERTLTTNEWRHAGSLGMRWLERTDLAERQGNRYNIAGDLVLQQGFSFMASRPALPAVTMESGAEPPGDASPDISEVLTVEERSVAK